MTVKVRLFARMAQEAKTSLLSIDVPEGSAASAARTALQKQFPALPWPAGTMIAVNQEYASPEHALRQGDEIAIIPPVSGG
jgi:molybdopterin synthase catalytic subunit